MERLKYRYKKGREIDVDMQFAPYTMDLICFNTGIGRGHGITANKIKKICQGVCEGDDNKIQGRINLLVRANLLQKQRLKKTELKSLYGSHFVKQGKKTYERLNVVGGKRNIYLLGKRGKQILKDYGQFTRSPLMNKRKPKIEYIEKKVPVTVEKEKIVEDRDKIYPIRRV